MSDNDAATYKQGQRELYAGNAPGWDKWADAMAEQAERLNQLLIEAAGIGPGAHVLDLASGAGEPALTAARAAGSDGQVTATDLTPEMLAIVKRRAEAGGLANMAFEVADMEDLQFDGASFDAVISRFGVMYSPEPARTFAEARRVLRPGGRVGFMVWGPLDGNTLLGTVITIAHARLGQQDDEEMEHPFRYGGKGSLAPLLEAAGLVEVEEQDFDFAPKIRIGMPFWKPLLEMNFAKGMADLDDAAKQALDREVEAAFQPFVDGDAYRVTMHVRIGVGRVA